MMSGTQQEGKKQVEYHRAVATEHEIELEDSLALIERKVKTTVRDENDQVTKVILHHTRSMLDGKTLQYKSYVVREVTVGDEVTEYEVTTMMTSDELEEFKTEWDTKWCKC